MDNVDEILIKLGLTDEESKVYLLILKTGGKTISEIRKKLSIGYSRANRAISRLIKHNLIQKESSNGKIEYISTRPSNILNLVEKNEII